MTASQGVTSLRTRDDVPLTEDRHRRAPLLVVVDAVIITVSGRRYLSDDAHPGINRAASRLTTTLFSLIVLGLVALISTVDRQWRCRASVTRAAVIDTGALRQLCDDTALGHQLSLILIDALFNRLQTTRIRLLDLHPQS